MALLNFKYGAQSGLASQSYTQGTVYITTDTKKMYVDLPGETGTHLCIGDFQLVNYSTGTALDALTNLTIKETNVLYLTVGPKGATALYRYTGTGFAIISNTDEVASLRADITTLQTDVAGKAPINHASSETTYGVGSDTLYGHVKLSDSTASSSSTGAGVAATPKAVKDAITTASNDATSKANAVLGASGDDATKNTVYGAKAAAAAAQSAANAAQTAAEAADNNADTRVLRSGDTMEGILILSADPTSTSNAKQAATKGYVDAAKTAAIDAAAEDAQEKANAVLGTSNDAAGTATVHGVLKTATNASTAASNANDNANTRVAKAGDTMTGFLTLHAAPTAEKHAATKDYVDTAKDAAIDAAAADATAKANAVLGSDADASTATTVYGVKKAAVAAANAATAANDNANTRVLKSGDTMAGFLTLHNAPTDDMHAATKKYVDDAKSSAISIVCGTASDTKDSATIVGAKKYTDDKISTVDSTVNNLKDAIGNLSNIMNFLGATTTALSDGATTAEISIGGSNVIAVNGDVVVSGNKEFVFDGTQWHEIGDVNAQSQGIVDLQNRMNTAESDIDNLEGRMNTAESDIDQLESWKDAHTSEYANLEGRVEALETWKGSHATEYTNLEKRVKANEDAISDGTDTASATGTINARIKHLQNNLGVYDAVAGSDSAFARIKRAETNITTLQTAVGSADDAASNTGSLFARVKDNDAAINDIITILTWGTF